jgi:GWxTD domain-containing protein
MPKNNAFSHFALALSVAGLCCSISFGQKKIESSPAEKPIKVKKEPKPSKAFDDWLTKDVPYIITTEEKEAYKRLKTNEERENFIATFWDRRDPNPDTEENEYRDEYYERIAYANEKFSNGIPGWKTDRGRIYISRGKPDSIESHPSGGSYDRPSYQGGGSTTTYPFEIWFYRHLDDVGDGLEIEFVDPTGTGEYRLARDSGEKDALATIPGAGFKATGNNNSDYLRQADTPFERLRITSELSKSPKVQFPDLQRIAGTSIGAVENENPIDFDLQIDFFKQSDNRVVTTFTLQAENKELSFKDAGGIQTANMNIFGKVTAVTGNKAGNFEDLASVSTTAQELIEARNNKSIYQKALSLQPGTYKVDVVVRDTESGKTGIVRKGFTVPRYDAEKLSTSTLILASRLYQTTEKDIGGSFVIGDKKVVPNLSGVYKKGQEVGVYLQIYNAEIDQTTLRPATDVEYILLKDGKQVYAQKENWEGLSDAGQRLTLARLIPTADLAVGNYELKIKLNDRVGNQQLEPTGKFTIVK